MLQDCTGTRKRLYLYTSIRQHIEQLDDVEMAVVLSWLKSGGIYRDPMLATLDPQKIIDKAEEINKEDEHKREAKRAEEDARRAEEKAAAEERDRARWKAKLGKK